MSCWQLTVIVADALLDGGVDELVGGPILAIWSSGICSMNVAKPPLLKAPSTVPNFAVRVVVFVNIPNEAVEEDDAELAELQEQHFFFKTGRSPRWSSGTLPYKLHGLLWVIWVRDDEGLCTRRAARCRCWILDADGDRLVFSGNLIYCEVHYGPKTLQAFMNRKCSYDVESCSQISNACMSHVSSQCHACGLQYFW